MKGSMRTALSRYTNLGVTPTENWRTHILFLFTFPEMVLQFKYVYALIFPFYLCSISRNFFPFSGIGDKQKHKLTFSW